MTKTSDCIQDMYTFAPLPADICRTSSEGHEILQNATQLKLANMQYLLANAVVHVPNRSLSLQMRCRVGRKNLLTKDPIRAMMGEEEDDDDDQGQELNDFVFMD